MFTMLFSRLLPPITAVIPLFFMMKTMRLIDSRLGLMLIYAALNTPFGVWLMKAFIDGIPRELEESAVVDGCSTIGAYLRITLPLAAPGLAATSIFLFVLGWNEFMFAFIFTSVKARPMTVLLAQATLGEYQIYWTDMAAMATVQVLPILIFSLIVQKHLVRGLTAGALK
jgi:multiple sugar transport system permease protein